MTRLRQSNAHRFPSNLRPKREREPRRCEWPKMLMSLSKARRFQDLIQGCKLACGQLPFLLKRLPARKFKAQLPPWDFCLWLRLRRWQSCAASAMSSPGESKRLHVFPEANRSDISVIKDPAKICSQTCRHCRHVYDASQKKHLLSRLLPGQAEPTTPS